MAVFLGPLLLLDEALDTEGEGLDDDWEDGLPELGFGHLAAWPAGGNGKGPLLLPPLRS